jgi:hypothetical protein
LPRVPGRTFRLADIPLSATRLPKYQIGNVVISGRRVIAIQQPRRVAVAKCGAVLINIPNVPRLVMVTPTVAVKLILSSFCNSHAEAVRRLNDLGGCLSQTFRFWRALVAPGGLIV